MVAESQKNIKFLRPILYVGVFFVIGFLFYFSPVVFQHSDGSQLAFLPKIDHAAATSCTFTWASKTNGTANVNYPSSKLYLQQSYRGSCTGSSASTTVTSMAFTMSATTGFSNMRIYYSTANNTNCNDADPLLDTLEATTGGSSVSSTTTITFTSPPTVSTATAACFYAVMDIGSTAANSGFTAKFTAGVCGVTCTAPSYTVGTLTPTRVCTSITTGTWSTGADWAFCNGNTGTGSAPISTDNVYIGAGTVMTVGANTTVGSLTIESPAEATDTANGVIINDTFTLTVTNALTFNADDTAVGQTITLGSSTGAGNLTVGSISIPAVTLASGSSKIGCAASNTGLLTVSTTGTTAITGGTVAGNSSIDLSGGNCSFTTGSGTTTITGGSTGVALLKISGGGTFTLKGTLAFAGTAGDAQFTTSASGATLALNGGTFPTGGTLSIAASMNVTSDNTSAINQTISNMGTLSVNSGTLTMGIAETWTNVTIANGATLAQGTSHALTISGNYTNNGTHTATTTGPSLTGASAILSGSGSYTGAATFAVNGTTGPSLAANSNLTLDNLTLAAGVPFSIANGSGGGAVCATNLTCLTITGGLTFTASGTAQSMTLGGASTLLTVGGATSIGQPTAAVISALNVNQGTATFNGTLTLAGTVTTSGFVNKIVLTTGTLNVNSSMIFGVSTATPAQHVIDCSGGAAAVNFGGTTFTSFATATLTAGTSGCKVNYNSSSTQTVQMGWGAGGYDNLLIMNTNASGATLSAAVTTANVAGTITVGDGTVAAVFSNNAFAIAMNNATAFTVNNNADFMMTTTTNLPTWGDSTKPTFGNSSTVEYKQTTAPTMTTAITYGNLTFDTTGNTKTFTLPAAITINGNLTVGGTGTGLIVTAATNNTPFTVSGTTTINANGTLTDGTGLITFTGAVTVTGTYNHAETAGSGIVFSSDLTNNGTVSGSGTGSMTADGNVTGTGTFNLTGGLFEQRVGANENFGAATGSNGWTFKNLTFSNSNSALHTIATQTGATGVVTVSGTLTIGKNTDNSSANTVLNAGDKTWALSSTSTPLSLATGPAATLTPSTSTFQYTGNGATATATTYNNLSFLPSSSTATVLGSGTFSVAGNLVVGNATHQGASAATNGSILNVTGTTTVNNGATFTQGSGAFTFTGNVTIGGGTSGIFACGTSAGATNMIGNLTLAVGSTWTKTNCGTVTFQSGTSSQTLTDNTASLQDLGTVEISVNTTNTTLTLQTSTKMTSLTVDASQTFSVGVGAFNVTISGTLTVNGTYCDGNSSCTGSNTGTTTVNGIVSGGGSITLDSSTTFLMSVGSTDTNFGSTANANAWSFNNLTFTATGSHTITTVAGGTGVINVSGVMTVSAATTLAAGSRTWNLNGSPNPGWSLVPSATLGQDASATTQSITTNALGAAVSLNDRIIIDVEIESFSADAGSPQTISTVTDSLGNIYTKDAEHNQTPSTGGTNGEDLTVWSAPVTVAGTPTFTITRNATPGGNRAFIVAAAAFRGLSTAGGPAAIDLSKVTGQVDSGSTVSVLDSGTTSGTTSAANELKIGVGGDWGENNTLSAGTLDTTYTQAAKLDSTGDSQIFLEYADSGSAGSTARATVNASPGETNYLYNAGVLVYKLAGDPLVVAGTFTANTSTVNFAGTAPANIPAVTYNNVAFIPASGSPNYYLTAGTLTANGTLTVGNASNAVTVNAGTATVNVTGLATVSASATLTSTSGTMTLGGSFTNNGTFNANGGTVALTTSSTATVATAANISFANFTVSGIGAAKTVKFTNAGAGQTTPVFTFTGTVTLNGASSQVLTINSDDNSHRWIAHFNNPVSPTWVAVSNSGCDAGTATATVDINSSLAGGNNGSCWVTVTVITVSGTVYTDTGSTVMTTGPTVRVKVNGAGSYSATANGSGVYSIPSVAVAAGNVVTVYLSGATQKAVTVTRALNNSSNISGLDLYQNYVIVRHEDSGPITNANLDQYDSGQDSDIQYTVTSGALTVTSGSSLYVWSGKTFNPGGNVTITNGSAIGDGTLTASTGTFLIDGTGNFGGNTAWTFNNLTFGDGSGTTTTTATGTGAITVSGAEIIAANQTLNAGSKTWNLTGSGLSGISYVQQAHTNYFNANGVITTSATGSGNLLVVAVTMNQTSGVSVSSITDNAGTPNTYVHYTAADSTDSFSVKTQVWYAANSNSGATTVTIHFTGGPSGTAFFYEFSGVATTNPEDDSSVGILQNQTTANPENGGTATPTSSGDLLISEVNTTSPSGPSAVGGPWTGFMSDVSGSKYAAAAYLIPGSTSAQTPSFTGDTASWEYSSSSFGFFPSSALPFINNGTFTAASSTMNFKGGAASIIPALTYNNVAFVPTTGVSTISLVNHLAQGSPNKNGFTTSSMDTTGANLLVMVITDSDDSTGTPSDNKSNTWHKAVDTNNSPNSATKTYYAWNANVGTGHTFTVPGTNNAPAVLVMAFSGSQTSSDPLDQSNAVSGLYGTPIATGSVTPGSNNELLVAGVNTGAQNTTSESIDSSFNKVDQLAEVPVQTNGGASAYLVQGTAGAVNPNWTDTSNSSYAADIATFKAGSAPSYTIGSGTLTANGTFTVGDGSDPMTLSAATNNPTINVTGATTVAATATFTSTSGTMTLGGNFTNNGTFTHNSGTVTFNGSGVSTIGGSASTTFNNLTDTTAGSTLKFANDAGGTTPKYTFAGTVTITGAVGNHITITSDNQPTNKWLVHFNNATSTITHVTVSYSDCDGTSQAVTLDADSTDGTNNGACWNFTTAGNVISGTLYSDDGSTVFNCSTHNVIIRVAKNGTLSQNVTCSAVGGTYTLPGVTSVSAGDVLTVFADNSTYSFAAVTRASTANSSFVVNLYQNRVILRHEDAGPITNTNVGQYDSSSNGNIKYTVSGGNLTVAAGNKLIVWTGKTFTPGGTVTTTAASTAANPDGDVLIQSSATLSMGTNALSVGGDFVNSGTFSKSTGQTTTFTATGTGFGITNGTGDFDSVTFNGTGGDWTPTNATVIDVNLTMTAGSLLGTQNVTVDGGGATGNGTINLTGGTFLIDGTGNFGGTTGWTFNNLTFGDGSGTTTTTSTGSGGTTVSNVLTIAANQTLDAKGKTWTLSGTTGTPFVITGVFSDSANTSTFAFTGNNGGGNTTVPSSAAYNNLTLNNGSETFNLGGNITLAGNLTVTAGTLSDTHNITVNGGGVTGAGTINLTGGTVTLAGTGNFGSASAWTFNNLTFSGTTTATSSGGVTVSGTLTISSTDSLNGGSQTWTLSKSGASGSRPFVNSGTFTPATSTVDYEGTAATDVETGGTSISYNNLNVGSASDTNAGVTYTLNGSVTVSGVLTVGNSGSTNADTLAAGANTLTLSGTGTPLTLASSAKGLFSDGTSTVQYTGSGTVAATTFYNLTFGSGSAITVTMPGSAINIGNNLVISNNASVTKGAGTVTFNAGGAQTWTDSNATAQDIGTVTTATGSTNLQLGSNVKATALTIAGSTTFTPGSNTLELTGTSSPFTVSGTFTIGTSTIKYSGTTATITSTTYNNLTLGGTGTYTTPASGSNITLRGNLVITSGASITKGASGGGTFIFGIGGGSTQNWTDSNGTSQDIGPVQISAHTGNSTLSLSSSVAATSVTIDSSQTLTTGANTLTLTAPSSIITGSFTPSSGSTIAYVPSQASGTVTLPSSITYYNLTLNKSSNTFAAPSGTLTINNNLNVTAGTFDLSANNPTTTVAGTTTIGGTLISTSGNLTLNGDFTNNGTFTHNSGTVILAPTGNSIQILGTSATTFYNLTDTTAGKAVIVKYGNTLTVNNNLTLTGTASGLIALKSTSAGSQWTINLVSSSNGSIHFVSVLDAACSGNNISTPNDTIQNLGNDGTCWGLVSRGGGGVVGGGGNGGSSGGGSGVGGGCVGSFCVVQKAVNETHNNANTVAATVASTVAGHLMVALVGGTNSLTASGVADNIGDTYTHVTNARGTNSSGLWSDAFYCANCSGGATSVTLTVNNTSTDDKSIWVFEVSGADALPLDAPAITTNAVGSSNVDTGAAVTTTNANDFIASAVISANSITGIKTGNSFQLGNIGVNTNASAYMFTTSTGTSTPQWSDTGAASAIASTTVAFKQANSNGSGTGGGTPIGNGAASFIQAAHNHNFSLQTSDLVATLGSNITSGNTIVVIATWGWPSSAGSAPNNAIVDGPGDTFTKATQVDDASNGQSMAMWFAQGSSGGSNTVTFKPSLVPNASGYDALVAEEFSGIVVNGSDTGNTHIVASNSGSSSTNGDTSGSFTSNVDGDLIVAGFMDDQATATTWSAGTSPKTFIIPTNGQDATASMALQYGAQTGHGAINPAISGNTTNGYISIGWGFKTQGSQGGGGGGGGGGSP